MISFDPDLGSPVIHFNLRKGPGNPDPAIVSLHRPIVVNVVPGTGIEPDSAGNGDGA